MRPCKLLIIKNIARSTKRAIFLEELQPLGYAKHLTFEGAMALRQLVRRGARSDETFTRGSAADRGAYLQSFSWSEDLKSA